MTTSKAGHIQLELDAEFHLHSSTVRKQSDNPACTQPKRKPTANPNSAQCQPNIINHSLAGGAQLSARKKENAGTAKNLHLSPRARRRIPGIGLWCAGNHRCTACCCCRWNAPSTALIIYTRAPLFRLLRARAITRSARRIIARQGDTQAL